MWTAIHIIDLTLWVLIAISVGYVFVFAVASLFYHRRQPTVTPDLSQSSFLILYPAYQEDAVIVPSVLQFLEQRYPKDRYHLVVISDHMSPATDDRLRKLPITLLTPDFEKSSKARALQYAISHSGHYDYVVVLDADNVVYPEFLQQLNAVCHQGHRAIQCHRCAKNSDSDIAILDGVSEEINNTLFRRAHNAMGLSSALIGSGMCFDYEWFRQHVDLLNSAVEDRELEVFLMRENVFIKFEDDIPVHDEKVSSQDNFQRQRLRWMNGQLQTLLLMLPYLPRAIRTANINYIDKTLQQALIPRSILLLLTPLLALLMTGVAPVWSIKWWLLFLLLCLGLLLAVPSQLRTRTIFGRVVMLPQLVLKLLHNLFHLNTKNKDFIHTTHSK